YAFQEVVAPEAGGAPVEIDLEPCVVRVRIETGNGAEADAAAQSMLRVKAVHVEDFRRGQAGEGAALVLAMVAESMDADTAGGHPPALHVPAGEHHGMVFRENRRVFSFSLTATPTAPVVVQVPPQ